MLETAKGKIGFASETQWFYIVHHQDSTLLRRVILISVLSGHFQLWHKGHVKRMYHPHNGAKLDIDLNWHENFITATVKSFIKWCVYTEWHFFHLLMMQLIIRAAECVTHGNNTFFIFPRRTSSPLCHWPCFLLCSRNISKQLCKTMAHNYPEQKALWHWQM